MNVRCSICHGTFVDGEPVKAIVDCHYKQLSSRVVYSISMPERCEKLYHVECFEEEAGDGPGAI